MVFKAVYWEVLSPTGLFSLILLLINYWFLTTSAVIVYCNLWSTRYY